jgi:hypothetical protein
MTDTKTVEFVGVFYTDMSGECCWYTDKETAERLSGESLQDASWKERVKGGYWVDAYGHLPLFTDLRYRVRIEITPLED